MHASEYSFISFAMKAILLSIAIVGGSAAPSKPHKASLIEPDLDPKSDKKFFGKDYPYDVSHRTKIDVPYPYPVVQASAAYDNDYTKDENHNKQDATNWELQLKHAKAVSEAAAEVERLQGKLAEEKGHVAAHKKVDVEKIKMPDEIDLASKDVEGGVKRLEDCKKSLEAAKEHLVRLQEEAGAADKSVKDAVDADKKAAEDEKTAEAKAAQLVSVIDAAEAAHGTADEKLKAEQAKLDDVKEKEKGFEERLRNFRGGAPAPPPATTEAPVPPPERDGAARMGVLLSVALAASAAAISCV
eukprot:TRINITY_DN1136_c0_g4_i1.p1 TRINITY_DN1136_c0_g4~~TRINITY_DN1136_c0_g4_i1.p1  ORF type:complete len:300 (-),score=112.60 TRINITY_DN1136_c0_g4_i1:103-1002(-)